MPRKKLPFLRRRVSRRGRNILKGVRVALRPPLMRDYRLWAHLRKANHVYLQLREPLWPRNELSRQNFRCRIRGYNFDARGDYGYAFFVWDRDIKELMGGVNLGHIRRGAAQIATLGYWIGQHYAGQGMMSEAVELVIDFAFTSLGLHRIEAACVIDNQASIGVLMNNGFREEGYAEKYLKINGTWADHRLFSLCRDNQAD